MFVFFFLTCIEGLPQLLFSSDFYLFVNIDVFANVDDFANICIESVRLTKISWRLASL